MKIVHVLPSLERGGGERLMIEFANREAAGGHEVTAIIGFPVPPELGHEGLSPDVKVRYVSARRVSGAARYRAILPWLWRNRAWLSEQDVVHCHLTYGAAFGTALKWLFKAMRRRRPAIVETYHAVGMTIPGYHTWTHARMAAGRDGLTFMVEDPYWKRFAEKRPRLNAKIIPVGVTGPDLSNVSGEERQAYRAKVGIPANARPIIGTIGRLAPARQSHRYIPIFAGIAHEFDQAHFLMGGDGSELGRVREAITAEGLEGRVHLPGLVRDLEPPFSVMDLYITSNVGSVPGVAGLQAIAAGLPVIALQLVDDHEAGESDWLWSSRDESRVAEKAIELLRSPRLMRALAAEQKSYLDAHHSPEAMAKAYEAFYQDALKQRA